MTTPIDISPEAVEESATRLYYQEFRRSAEQLRELRLQLTASEKRIEELVARYETDDPIKPTAQERQQWADGECGKAVRAYRDRNNCGLREAVDAMKGET